MNAGLFYRSSVGTVAGVELVDGRCAVLKAHQPARSRERLAEVVRLQNHLAPQGRFAPADGGAFAYSVAYTTRCGHAFGKRERAQAGTFHALLARHGEHLLAL